MHHIDLLLGATVDRKSKFILSRKADYLIEVEIVLYCREQQNLWLYIVKSVDPDVSDPIIGLDLMHLITSYRKI